MNRNSNWSTSNSSYGSSYNNRSLLNSSPQKRTYNISSSYPPSPLGLENLTNTCYISAVLQVLFEIINESDFPITSKSKQEITSLFLSLKKSKSTDEYRRFKEALEKKIEIVQGWEQQDSHELLIQLIDQFRKENSEKLSGGNPDLAYKEKLSIEENWRSFVKEMQKIEKSKIISIFYGDMLKKYVCPYSHEKYSFERYSNLSLPFSPKTSSSRYYYSQGPLELSDMIEEYLGQEIIDDLYCEKCKEKMRFRKRGYLYTCPKYLILHLSRFIKGYYDNQKNTREVSFDESIRIDEFGTKSSVKYQLMGVIHHLGSLNRGHYYADVKVDGQWYEFDDERVRKGSIYGVRNHSKSVYLLIYKRT